MAMMKNIEKAVYIMQTIVSYVLRNEDNFSKKFFQKKSGSKMTFLQSQNLLRVYVLHT